MPYEDQHYGREAFFPLNEEVILAYERAYLEAVKDSIDLLAATLRGEGERTVRFYGGLRGDTSFDLADSGGEEVGDGGETCDRCGAPLRSMD